MASAEEEDRPRCLRRVDVGLSLILALDKAIHAKEEKGELPIIEVVNCNIVDVEWMMSIVMPIDFVDRTM